LLLSIKSHIESIANGVVFNSVLANLYRNGADGVAWHSDDEPELGPAPVIASVTFGQSRPFQLRHRRDKLLKYSLLLPHGSLLLMRGETQRHWQHQIPKSAKPMQARINLTFRVVCFNWRVI
jgi:alkylated DNA repair dioxygenase AlkB